MYLETLGSMRKILQKHSVWDLRKLLIELSLWNILSKTVSITIIFRAKVHRDSQHFEMKMNTKVFQTNTEYKKKKNKLPINSYYIIRIILYH